MSGSNAPNTSGSSTRSSTRHPPKAAATDACDPHSVNASTRTCGNALAFAPVSSRPNSVTLSSVSGTSSMNPSTAISRRERSHAPFVPRPATGAATRRAYASLPHSHRRRTGTSPHKTAPSHAPAAAETAAPADQSHPTHPRSHPAQQPPPTPPTRSHPSTAHRQIPTPPHSPHPHPNNTHTHHHTPLRQTPQNTKTPDPNRETHAVKRQPRRRHPPFPHVGA